MCSTYSSAKCDELEKDREKNDQEIYEKKTELLEPKLGDSADELELEKITFCYMVIEN